MWVPGAGFAMVFSLLISAIIWNLRHLVFWPASLQFAHADRLYYGRGLANLCAKRARVRRRSELGQGARSVHVLAGFTNHRLCLRWRFAAFAEGSCESA